MTSWQVTRIVAGVFILASLALGVPGSPVFHSPWWLALTAFVGFTRQQIRRRSHQVSVTLDADFEFAPKQVRPAA